MKKLAFMLISVVVAGAAIFQFYPVNSDQIQHLLKKYKIIASKPDVYYSYDQISKKYGWGLIAKQDNLYYITDLDGNKLNETAFHRIHPFTEHGLAKVENSERKVGLLNTKGQLVVDMKFDKIGDFNEQNITLVETRIPYAQQQANQIRYKSRQGLMNSDGHWIIEPTYFRIQYLKEPNLYLVDHYHYQERLGTKRSLFSIEKGWLADATFDSIGPFKNGIAIVKRNKLVGVINHQAEYVIPLNYLTIFEMSDGLILAYDQQDRAGFFDATGKIAIPFKDYRPEPFKFGVSKVMDSKGRRKYALMDKAGTLLTDYKFDDIDAFNHYSDINITAAQASLLNSRFNGLIGTDGQFILEPKYSTIQYESNGYFKTQTYVYPEDKSKGTLKYHYYVDLKGNDYAAVDTQNPKGYKPETIAKLGLLSASREVIFEPKFDDIRPAFQNIIEVRIGSHWGVINEDGEQLLPLVYQNIDFVSPTLARVKKAGKWGLYSLEANSLIVPTRYSALEVTAMNQVKVKQNNQWQIIAF